VLFLISTLNDGDAHLNACCCFNTPVYATSQLDEGILCVFFALGKLGYGEAFSSFVERRPA
jgi:hypothetical protein